MHSKTPLDYKWHFKYSSKLDYLKPKEDMQIPPKQARRFEQGTFLVQDDSAAHCINMLQVIMGYNWV